MPYLKYQTVGDAKVRPEHQMIDGVTLQIDDPFWDEFYPPNGWGCRCDVIQVVGPEQKPNLIPNNNQVKPAFRHNPAKSREIFSQDHPYYKSIRGNQRERLLRAVGELQYNNYSDDYTKITYNKNSSGYVVAHRDHTATELKDNTKLARTLSRHGFGVELLADRPGQKSPDALLDGLLWEFKTINVSKVRNAVQTQLRRGKRQAQRIAVRLPKTYRWGDLLAAMKFAISNDKKERIQEVILIYADGSISRVTRKEIIEQPYKNQFPKQKPK